jgi:adenosyl cobinamide kinase/adenosyl cobinamide phosphate guanylyltransferase
MNEPTPEVPKFFDDIWTTILDDRWMWCVIWGKPRTGKTTVQLKAGFHVYKDWDQVLQSFVFNLAGILYKMKSGVPCRIMTRNMLHNRVPLLNADDFGAQSNKAKTQHEPAWDIFKGAFDTLGTKVGVLLASMGNPSSATQQLQEKYTHEIYVESRGHAKYDTVDWQQNYSSWQARQNKDWQQSFDFTPVASDIYKEYDEMRLALVDELFQLIDDSMIENEGLRILRRLTDEDVEFIELLQDKGQVSSMWMKANDKWREVLKRCKARSIVVPVRKADNYWYDLTDFGFNLYTLIQAKRKEGTLNTVTPRPKDREKPLLQL